MHPSCNRTRQWTRHERTRTRVYTYMRCIVVLTAVRSDEITRVCAKQRDIRVMRLVWYNVREASVQSFVDVCRTCSQSRGDRWKIPRTSPRKLHFRRDNLLMVRFQMFLSVVEVQRRLRRASVFAGWFFFHPKANAFFLDCAFVFFPLFHQLRAINTGVIPAHSCNTLINSYAIFANSSRLVTRRDVAARQLCKSTEFCRRVCNSPRRNWENCLTAMHFTSRIPVSRLPSTRPKNRRERAVSV